MNVAVLVTSALMFMCALLWVVSRARRRNDRVRSGSATRAFEPTRDHWVLAASCGLGAWTWHAADNLVEWDASMFDVFELPLGRAPRDLDEFLDLIAPIDRARLRDALTNPSNTSVSLGVECRVARTGRNVRMLARRLAVSSSDAPGSVRVVGLCQDVAKRRELERQQEEQARLAEFLATVGSALTENSPLEMALERCAAAMVELLDVTVCRIWIADASGTMLELKASAGRSPERNLDVQAIPVADFTSGRMADQQWVARERLHGFGGYPLLVDDRLVGVLTMFSRRSLSHATITALAIVAKHLALGIHRRREDAVVDVAQNVNNLLTAILVCVDMLTNRLPQDSPERRHLEDIDTAATRAGDLTRQLLRFAGRTL
jgi:signal transduction histidine kinase